MQTEPQLKRPDLFRSAILIGGEWVKDSSAGEPIAVVDPATGRLLGTVPNAGRAETARAIEAADAAFPAWREKTAAERADHLRRLAQLITDNKEDLARILTAEQGKPLAEARGEVGMSAAYVQWFAEEGRRIYGDVIPSPWQNRRILDEATDLVNHQQHND